MRRAGPPSTDRTVLLAVLVLPSAGAAGMVLVQVAFQFDAPSSSYPDDLTANPITAVVLGALRPLENIPDGARDLLIFITWRPSSMRCTTR